MFHEEDEDWDDKDIKSMTPLDELVNDITKE